MSIKVHKINIALFKEGVESDLYNELPEYLEYINEAQPIDTSVTRDNIVLRKETEVDVVNNSNSIDLKVDMNTDYAEFRNEHNNLNPDKLGYIEKTLDKGLEIAENVDYSSHVRLK